MFFLESASMDPYENLALEEYLFNHKKPNTSIFMLWQNLNTVVLGKNQNAAEEINKEYVDAHAVWVARRLSGGGAVYHDRGNLNFTFITDQEKIADFDFSIFTIPVINTLKRLGIEAEFNGRNDVTIEGKKFSGNSQYARNGKLLHHGCIMLDTELEAVAGALKPPEGKFTSKSVKSVRSRVTSINQHTSRKMGMEEFKNLLKQEIAKVTPLQKIALSDEAWAEISRLRSEKYASIDWIYGKSPAYGLRRTHKFPTAFVEAYLDVKNARIQSIRFFGDFFGNEDVHELEEALRGVHLFSELEQRLEILHVSRYMHGLCAQDLITLLR